MNICDIICRDYHPESVFTHMESIMILVIEESEDVMLELLTSILSVLKKDKEVRCNLVGWVCCTHCCEEFM